MEYRIEKKPQFTVMGIARKFNCATAYCEIPKFWDEFMKSDLPDEIDGTYGLCFDGCGGEFTYYIADDYYPWAEIPSNLEIKIISAHTWAVFSCFGKLPESLQKLNDEIWKEWLPSNGKYRLAENMNIEFYAPSSDDSEIDYCEIWIPVEEV